MFVAQLKCSTEARGQRASRHRFWHATLKIEYRLTSTTSTEGDSEPYRLLQVVWDYDISESECHMLTLGEANFNATTNIRRAHLYKGKLLTLFSSTDGVRCPWQTSSVAIFRTRWRSPTPQNSDCWRQQPSGYEFSGRSTVTMYTTDTQTDSNLSSLHPPRGQHVNTWQS